MLDAFGNTLQSFTYDDVRPWPSTPDAGGPSLEYVGPLDAGENPSDGAPADPFDNPLNWQASIQDGGTPGVGNGVEEDADFNDDTVVSGLDFLIWQRNFGATSVDNSNGNANGDNLVNATDLNIWQSLYGTSVSTVLAASSSD